MRGSLVPDRFGRWGKGPLETLNRTIGVAPAEPGLTHRHRPPDDRVGRGDMDVATCAGPPSCFCRLEVAGALFSGGDTHAAQGDPPPRSLRQGHRKPPSASACNSIC